jgi:hypothetical protein
MISASVVPMKIRRDQSRLILSVHKYDRTRMTRLRAEAPQRAGADRTDYRGFYTLLSVLELSVQIRSDQI